MKKLYHKLIFVPEFVAEVLDRMAAENAVFELQYSSHALKAAGQDIYEEIILPTRLYTARAEWFEVEVEDHRITKVVYITDYCEEFNLIIVILVDSGIVKTVWLNEKSDTHVTLRRANYDVE